MLDRVGISEKGAGMGFARPLGKLRMADDIDPRKLPAARFGKRDGQDRFAKNIVFRDCVAINTNTPSTLGVGFSMPHQNAAPEYGMKAINTKVEGAVEAYNNFRPVAE